MYGTSFLHPSSPLCGHNKWWSLLAFDVYWFFIGFYLLPCMESITDHHKWICMAQTHTHTYLVIYVVYIIWTWYLKANFNRSFFPLHLKKRRRSWRCEKPKNQHRCTWLVRGLLVPMGVILFSIFRVFLFVYDFLIYLKLSFFMFLQNFNLFQIKTLITRCTNCGPSEEGWKYPFDLINLHKYIQKLKWNIPQIPN